MATKKEKPKKIRVRIHPGIVKRRGAFYDLGAGQAIGPVKDPDEVLEVLETPFVREKIRTGELILVGKEEKK